MTTTDTDLLPDLDRAGRPIVRPLIHHFGIATTRLDEMTQWYRDVLGLEIVAEAKHPLPNMAFVTSDEQPHRGGFFSPSTLKDNPDRLDYSRVQHLAWQYDDVDRLLESWDRIRALGIEHRSCWCHTRAFAIYYKDPDVNTVELTAPAYDDPHEGLAVVRTAEWAKAPNGLAVDPPKLIEARANGVSLDELRERSMAGEYLPEVEPSPLSTW